MTLDISTHFAKLVPPQFKLDAGEELDVCPYNKAHYCLKHKSEAHVDRCRRAYIFTHTTVDQPVELFSCKFMATHLVPHVELSWHQKRCAFKNNPLFAPRPTTAEVVADWVEASKKFMRPRQQLTLNDLDAVELEMMLAEYKWRNWEDWDLESLWIDKTHKPFNPVVGVVDGSVPWLPPGLPKSARNEFRKLHQDVANLDRGGSALLQQPIKRISKKRRREMTFADPELT